VDLWGEDDNSGRQRWEILPNGAAAPVGVTPFSFYIRVLCGVTGDQQYFGVDTDPDPGFPNGRIQLVTKNLAASWVLYKDPDEAHYDIVLYKEKGVQLRVLPTNNVLGLKPFDPSVAVPFWQVAKVSR
jgi:hypothetical protein